MDIVVNTWFWDQPATGSGQYVRHLLPALIDLAPGSHFHPVSPGPASRSQLAGLFYKLWFEQVVFPRAATRQHADVAHIPYFAAPVRLATPTVTTVHDLIPMVLPAYRRSVLVRVYTRLVAAGTRWADAIIADSECSKRDTVAHLAVEPQRVHVIPLAAGPQFQPAAPEHIEHVRSRYSLPERYVLYLGGFDQRKNVPALLRAFAQLRKQGLQATELRLVVAGRLPAADTGFTPDPQRVAADLALEESVIFPGWIAETDKPALYSGAELFVFPSIYEGFGLPVLEAMACGAPVMTSNASSLPEVAGEAGLTVDPNDIGALAQTMAVVLGDEERRQAMREAGLTWASCFSWKRTAQATLGVYRSVTSRVGIDRRRMYRE